MGSEGEGKPGCHQLGKVPSCPATGMGNGTNRGVFQFTTHPKNLVFCFLACVGKKVLSCLGSCLKGPCGANGRETENIACPSQGWGPGPLGKVLCPWVTEMSAMLSQSRR